MLKVVWECLGRGGPSVLGCVGSYCPSQDSRQSVGLALGQRDWCPLHVAGQTDSVGALRLLGVAGNSCISSTKIKKTEVAMSQEVPVLASYHVSELRFLPRSWVSGSSFFLTLVTLSWLYFFLFFLMTKHCLSRKKLLTGWGKDTDPTGIR